MSVAAFATLEQQGNAAVMRSLANATARISAGAPLPVIFDHEYVLAEVGETGMAATHPAIALPTGAVPSPATGLRVELMSNAGQSYWKTVEHHPDGTGLSVLLLERSA